MKRILIPAAGSLAIALLSLPAMAQGSDEKVNQLIVYGDDPCPASTDGTITVCARKGESDRYRVPEVLRGNPDGVANEAWTERVMAYETVGDTGIQSCTPVGPGGATGCTAKLIKQAYAERAKGSDVRFGQLIEAERAKRLSTIDAEAAEQQARVEQLEKEYEAKLARERAGEVAPAR